MNNMNGYQQNFYGGMQPGVAPTQGAFNMTPVKPWLPSVDIAELRRDGSQFTLSSTPEDIKRAQCNHRNDDGSPSILPNDDGSCTCNVCGYTFTIANQLTKEEVEAACKLVENILQTSKLMYMSLDPQIGRDFFQIIAFLRKVPKMYEIASNDFKRYESVYGFTQGVPQNAFAVFGSMNAPGYFGAMGMGNPQYTGQPMGGMGYGAPQGYQQPMMGGQPTPVSSPMGTMASPQMPQYQQQYYQQPAMANPFYAGQVQGMGYGAPQGYQQPVQNTQAGGFAMNPTGAAGPAPTAPQTAASQVAPNNAPAKDVQADTGAKYEA